MSATNSTWSNGNPPDLEDDDLNGFKNENNNLIEGSNQTLDTGDLQQTHKGVAIYAAAGNYLLDGGIADAYVLSGVGNRIGAPTLEAGLTARWVPANNGTGAATLNYAGTGVVSIKHVGGTVNPISGDIVTTREYLTTYRTSPGAHWELTSIAGAGVIENAAGFVAARNWFSSAGGGVTASVAVDAAAENQWESYGPTGSGADNTWTALDALPANTTILEVSAHVTFDTDGLNRTGVVKVWGRQTGSGASALPARLVAVVTITADDLIGNAESAPIFRIPVDSSLHFDLQWDGVNIDPPDIDIYLKGYATP